MRGYGCCNTPCGGRFSAPLSFFIDFPGYLCYYSKKGGVLWLNELL